VPRTVKLALGVAAAAAICAALAIGLVLSGWHSSGDNNKDSGGKADLKHYPNTNEVEDWQRHPETESLAIVMDQKADYGQRLRAIEKLDNDLRQKLILDILKTVKNPEVDEAIRNDLLGKLESQEKPLGTLGPLLVEMHGNPADTWKWKNYCLQHAVPVWKLEADHRKDLVDFLFKVMEEEKGEGKDAAVMYETAMLSLSKIGASDPEVAGRVAKLASAKIAEKGKDPERAVTAMHVATGAGDKSILPEARKTAVDEKALARLRMSAMAALGSLGEKEDVALLQALASGPEGRIKECARLNLDTLKARLAK